jgi:hypothetical protein
MEPHTILTVGEKYSKKNLAELLNQPNLAKVREGIARCENSSATLFFVDLEKLGKEQRFHFNDFFQEDFFHWDSQTTQHINTPTIQQIVKGDLTPHLFVRVVQKIKNVTQPFIYCGRLVFDTYEEGTSKPIHMLFQNIDYDDYTNNDDLIDIYLWKPSRVGRETQSKINRQGVISPTRARKYKKPDETERKGLVTSRVGQGYYRQQIIEQWEGTCPVSGVTITPLLIASHIVPWSQSNDEEKLDVNNGILLSPNVDALFDKHLISFENDGSILISDKVSGEDREALGVSESGRITVSEGMIPYLERHRQKFGESS